MLAQTVKAQTVNVYVSATGDTIGNGQSASAPVNLTKARLIAKANRQNPVIVWLEPGIYSAFGLDESDSRSASAPLTFQATSPNGVIFQPEVGLNIKNFSPIPDSIKNRIINATAKTNVMQMSLSSLDLPDDAPWANLIYVNNLRSPHFYLNGSPLPMSRYPADTTMAIKQVVTRGSQNSSPGGSFKYRDGRAQYWQSAVQDEGLYLCGNWQYPWEMYVIKTLSINTADSLITQAEGISGGIGTLDPSRIPSGAEPYYALNLVEEINAPGQWSVNFRTKMLYMWVPTMGTLTCAGNASDPAILLNDVSNARFIGIAVRGGTGNGFQLNNCSNVLIAGCHVSDCSMDGILVNDGTNCTIQSNDIDSVGAAGVVISSSNFSADQSSMKASGHQVINNHIYSFAREEFLYQAAIDVSHAIGAYVAYNKVHDGPHVGILFGGNNNVLEYNEVYDVVKKYTDMGAFYRSVPGEAWMMRGNKVDHNLIHDAPQANGIYEDNNCSGDSISYNIIANTSLATFNNAGYFNAYANNIYLHDIYPVTTLTDATTDAAYPANYDSLKKLWNGSAAYKAAYPECADMVGSSGRNNSYTSRIWPVVTGNVFVTNPNVLSYVEDSKLFETNGATNAAYAQTVPFTSYGVVFTNDYKMEGKLTNASLSFNMDSLRSTDAFGQTKGTNWHIGMIGLHKDAYRTDISTTKTAGIDPIITLNYASTNNFTNPQTVTLTIGVKGPNGNGELATIWFTDNGSLLKGLPLTKKIVSYDSMVFIATWVNPPVGSHKVALTGGEGQYWVWSSNTGAFTIKSATASTALSVSSNAQSMTAQTVALNWTTPAETQVDSYEILASTDGIHFEPFSRVTAKCNDSSDCSYTLPVPQKLDQLTYYQVRVIASDGTTRMSNIAQSQLDFSGRHLILYPNPAKESVNIAFSSTKAWGNTNLVIYDLAGRALLKQPVYLPAGETQMSLPLGDIADGIYLVVLENGQETIQSQRLVIHR